MAVCPRCDSSNPDANRFCGQCGASLTTRLAGSGSGSGGSGADASTPATSTSAAPHPTREERKLATVLFADVVGFTSLAERTDPEIVAHLVDSAFRRLGEAVEAHGGTVDKFMGDSVMAVFGVPTAHDDDAERAVAAALAMRDLGGELALSIGVNSGEVMVTSLGREGDMTVIGDTVNVAARLEKAAGPGEVLCGRLTVELARGRVRFAKHRPVILKGKQEPVEVFVAESLLAAPEEPTTGPDAPGRRASLVGRDEELDYLLAHWRRVLRDKTARVVLLTGEAGSGKTRLQQELAAQVAAISPHATIVRAAYPSYGLRGGARMAQEIAAQLGPTADPALAARLRSIAGELDPALESIPLEGVLQEQVWALTAFLREKSRRQPLLLILDDLHRSDDRTLEIVSEVAGHLGDTPVLLLLAGRQQPADWTDRFHDASSVRLPPLSRADSAALASELLGGKALGSEAAGFLARRANGNPLYLRELVRMAEARGLFHEDPADGSYHLGAYQAIPATLHAVLAARLDALSPPEKLTLQHLAVLGQRSTAEQIAELGPTGSATALEHLSQAGLLTQDGGGRYEISDSLLQEVAYETLPRTARGELHRLAAEAARNGEERARHLDRAAKYLSADAELALQASFALADEGEELVGVSRHRDAMRVLERAVELGCRRPSALLALGRILALAGQHHRALEVLRLVEDDPADPGVAIERDHLAANSEAFDDPAAAAPRLEAAAERWRTLGETAKEGWAFSNAGVCYLNMGRLAEAIDRFERSLPLFETAADTEGRLVATSYLCLVDPVDPRVPLWLAEALEIADATGDRLRQMSTLTMLTWHEFFTSFWGGEDEVARAEGFARRLDELAEEVGALNLCVHARSLLVVSARASGRFAEMDAHALDLQRILGSVGHPETWLGWAATFSSAMGNGVLDAAPPFPLEGAADPVVALARVLVETELHLAGRIGESIDHAARPDLAHLGVMGELLAVAQGLAFLLADRPADAGPVLEHSRAAALRLGSVPVGMAASSLLAEVDKDPTLLDGLAPPGDLLARWRRGAPLGVAEALLLRAHRQCRTGLVSDEDLEAVLADLRASGLGLP